MRILANAILVLAGAVVFSAGLIKEVESAMTVGAIVAFVGLILMASEFTREYWSELQRQHHEERDFLESLGEEIGPDTCRRAGCERKRIALNDLCRTHHFEWITGRKPFRRGRLAGTDQAAEENSNK